MIKVVVAAVVAGLLIQPAAGKDIFRCTTDTGAVEYRDAPCAPNNSMALVPVPQMTTQDHVNSQRAITDLREQSRAADERAAFRARMAAERREADDRERRHQETLAAIEASKPEPLPPVEPQVVYVPYAVPVPVTPYRRPPPPPAALPPPPVKKKK